MQIKIKILIMHYSSSPILEYTWVDVLTSYEHQFCGDGGREGGSHTRYMYIIKLGNRFLTFSYFVLTCYCIDFLTTIPHHQTMNR